MHKGLPSLRWVVIIIATLALGLIGTQNAFACQIGSGCYYPQNPPCNNGFWFAGGYEAHSTNPYPQDVWGSVSSYNPAPVWSSSSTWIALENTQYYSYATIAQVGWVHWYGCQSIYHGSNGSCSDGNEHVFVEWTDNAGNYSPIYYFGVPSSSERYEVKRVSGNHFTFYWNEGSYTSANPITWGPDTDVAVNEVHDFIAPGQGSHAAGDTTTHEAVQNVDYTDQNGYTYFANFKYGSSSNPSYLGSTDYQALNSDSQNSFELWDSRCSN